MKRDWDVIRDVLVDVEGIDNGLGNSGFRLNMAESYADQSPAYHFFMLYDASMVSGINADSLEGRCVLNPELTWQGRELLDTLRSKPVWEKTKAIAQEKGIALSFESVMKIGALALGRIIES